MQNSNALFCYSKLPWTLEVTSKIMDNLDTCSQKVSPALI
jgi:hypothetical protein